MVVWVAVAVAVVVAVAGAAVRGAPLGVLTFGKGLGEGVDVTVGVSGKGLGVDVGDGGVVGVAGIRVGGMSVGSTKAECVGTTGVDDGTHPAAMPTVTQETIKYNPTFFIKALREYLGDLVPCFKGSPFSHLLGGCGMIRKTPASDTAPLTREEAYHAAGIWE